MHRAPFLSIILRLFAANNLAIVLTFFAFSSAESRTCERVFTSLELHLRTQGTDNRTIDAVLLESIVQKQLAQFDQNAARKRLHLEQQIELPQWDQWISKNELTEAKRILQSIRQNYGHEGEAALRDFFGNLHEVIFKKMSRRKISPQQALAQIINSLKQIEASLSKNPSATPIPSRIFEGDLKSQRQDLQRQLESSRSLTDLESHFDVWSRKSSGTTEYIHEVDVALLRAGKVPDKKIKHSLQISEQNDDKVFALHSSDAIAFEGQLANGRTERFYALILPKGFTEQYGMDLRNDARAQAMSAKTFAQENQFRQTEKIFLIRKERGRDQVHIQLGWKNLRLPEGSTKSLAEILETEILATVEFDQSGRIIDIEWNPRAAAPEPF